MRSPQNHRISVARYLNVLLKYRPMAKRIGKAYILKEIEVVCSFFMILLLLRDYFFSRRYYA